MKVNGYNMHEFNIIENIFKIIEDIIKKEKINKVDKVNLLIGEMLQIVPETLVFAFDSVKKGTKYENSTLNIEIKPILGKCNICKSNIELSKDQFICPECNNNDFEIISGKELIIKSIEGE